MGRVFRDVFNDKAGWAHSVLFAAELPEFRKLLPISMQDEMKSFAQLLKETKQQKKDASAAAKKASSPAAKSKDTTPMPRSRAKAASANEPKEKPNTSSASIRRGADTKSTSARKRQKRTFVIEHCKSW